MLAERTHQLDCIDFGGSDRGGQPIQSRYIHIACADWATLSPHNPILGYGDRRGGGGGGGGGFRGKY